MRRYNKILVWENNRRLKKLIDFRELVIAYFDTARTELNVDSKNIEITAPEARKRINRSVQEVHSMIVQSEINPILTWRAPATIGGFVRKVDLVYNIFNLEDFLLDANSTIDVLDRSIGIYESDHKKALARAFNPLFYVGLVLDFISGLPFIFLGKLGLNRQMMEVSVVGRLVKSVLYLIQVIAALIAIYQFWDYWTPVKNFVRELVGP